MEDDDIGITRGIRCARQRGEFPDRKALLGQLVGQESAIDRAVLDEKDANRIRFADWGEQHRCTGIQARDIFKNGGHLKLLPLAYRNAKTGREGTARRPASRQSSAVTRDGADSTIHAPSAQPAETSITHVTHIAFDACRAAPLPFAHRKRLPKARKLAERTHRGGDQFVATSVASWTGRASEARGTPIRRTGLGLQSIHDRPLGFLFEPKSRL